MQDTVREVTERLTYKTLSFSEETCVTEIAIGTIISGIKVPKKEASLGWEGILQIICI